MQFALTELKENESWLKLYHSKMLQMIPHQIDGARWMEIRLHKLIDGKIKQVTIPRGLVDGMP